MPINHSLPKAGLKGEKLTLSPDNATVLYCGQEIPTAHFVKVTVPSLLGFYHVGSAGAFELLSEMNANGFSLAAYGKHTDHWAMTIQNQREDMARREQEAKEHRERMDAILASPEEIAKAVAERKAREAELQNRFGARGKMAAFGNF